MSQLLRWATPMHTMRYHAYYKTSDKGHDYQGRFKSFPVQDDDYFLVRCRSNRLIGDLVINIQEIAMHRR